jgi:hypothetical protein
VALPSCFNPASARVLCDVTMKMQARGGRHVLRVFSGQRQAAMRRLNTALNNSRDYFAQLTRATTARNHHA